MREQAWLTRCMCAHVNLAWLQLSLKCSSDQDERKGSPSPNHLALIAGKSAVLSPWWGGELLTLRFPAATVWAHGGEGGFGGAREES